jgi:hypothetical protein
MPRLSLLLLLPPLAALALLVPADAAACGAFFKRGPTVTVPSLQVEQVLILHDPVKEQEHFIRQLSFRDAKEPFGFVVPTPSRPTVARVASSPFAELAKQFPPEGGLGLLLGLGGGGMSHSRRAGSGAAPAVTVLSKERIGSFTAFVLAATDASALERWLKENSFETTPESRAWLSHYVAVGFYFTAFRYEPDAKVAGTTVKSETVRISFATPLPFYPYQEPVHPQPEANVPRVLAVWFVSPERSIPVANVTDDAGSHVRRPWAEDTTHPATKAVDLRPSLGPLADLLPGAPGDALVMQTFEDQKSSRRGWGDVVLVPEVARPIDPAKRDRMNKLIAALGDGT